MHSVSRVAVPNTWIHPGTLMVVMLAALCIALPDARAQGAGQTGTIAGRVVDEHGAPVTSAQVFIDRTTIGTLTRGDGSYVMGQVPAGAQIVRIRLIGFRPDSASVSVTTLTPRVIQQSAPRSTTEMLRYVPGLTRVESSGGEVNENITMRGI